MSRSEYKPTTKHQALIDAANEVEIDHQSIRDYLQSIEHLVMGSRIIIESDAADLDYEARGAIEILNNAVDKLFHVRAMLDGANPEENGFSVTDKRQSSPIRLASSGAES